MELITKTREMIDNIKNVCANFGLGNSSSEYKIITEIFLYKFLNDKFLYNARNENPKFKNLSFAELEKELLNMNEKEFAEIYEHINIDSAKFQRQNLISSLYNRQNEDGFHKLLDHTLTSIANDNIEIFSGRTGKGAKIKLFDPLSAHIIDADKKDAFAKALLDKISQFSFESAFSQKYDFFSTIFEYLIRDYNKDSGKYAEYYTPHTIAQIIAQILAPNGDRNVKIYDPAAGTGTLILALAHQIGDKKCTLYSQDISQKSNELLRLNLILNNLILSLPNVICDDTLTHPYHTNKTKDNLAQFDYIVSNPPFNMDFSDNRETLAGEKHKSRFFAGVPSIPNKKKDSMAIYQMFIQHIIYSLNDKGKGAIVVPTGFLTAGSGIPKTIREHIIKHKMLKGAISMPSNVFATTGTNVSILFLDKQNQDDQILLMDASKLGITTKEGKNQKTILQEQDIKQIVETFNNKANYEDFSILVSNEDIANKNYSFSAGQYFEIKIEYEPITQEEFTQKMNEYKASLDSLFAEGRELEEEIKKQLGKVEL